jgi:hypothetical protein
MASGKAELNLSGWFFKVGADATVTPKRKYVENVPTEKQELETDEIFHYKAWTLYGDWFRYEIDANGQIVYDVSPKGKKKPRKVLNKAFTGMVAYLPEEPEVEEDELYTLDGFLTMSYYGKIDRSVPVSHTFVGRMNPVKPEHKEQPKAS